MQCWCRAQCWCWGVCSQPQGAHMGQGHPHGFAVTSAARFSPEANDHRVASNTNWNTPVWFLTPRLCMLSFLATAGHQTLGETNAPGRGAGHVESCNSEQQLVQLLLPALMPGRLLASPLCSAAIHAAIRVKMLLRLSSYPPRLGLQRRAWSLQTQLPSVEM